MTDYVPDQRSPAGNGVSPGQTRLTHEPLEARELERLVARPGAGAVCTFAGVVRDTNEGRDVHYLEYEAYPEMALPGMQAIVAEIEQRWAGSRVAMAHRLGRLEIGEPSVIIAVSHPHRGEAFEACRYAIDTLKAQVPIWKKEVFADGEVWLDGTAPFPLDITPQA
jgi:molybdopterin synthase catalytic subunit